MKPAEIQAMAKEVGFLVGKMASGTVEFDFAMAIGNGCMVELTRFAALVAAKAAADEREALRVVVRSSIQAARYHISDRAKADVAERVLLDLLDDVNARSPQ